MNDFCDGKTFKSHPLFSVHSNALQIFFYFDELEICNPLGSKAKIHKLGKFMYINNIMLYYFLGAFYFTLGNISPKYRSQLSAIQLVALVKSSFVSTYGMDEILKPFVNDVKKLV